MEACKISTHQTGTDLGFSQPYGTCTRKRQINRIGEGCVSWAKTKVILQKELCTTHMVWQVLHIYAYLENYLRGLIVIFLLGFAFSDQRDTGSRPHSRPLAFATTRIRDHSHSRPLAFATTRIRDHSHSRPLAFATTRIRDSRPLAFATTRIRDHSHSRSLAFAITRIRDHSHSRSLAKRLSRGKGKERIVVGSCCPVHWDEK